MKSSIFLTKRNMSVAQDSIWLIVSTSAVTPVEAWERATRRLNRPHADTIAWETVSRRTSLCDERLQVDLPDNPKAQDIRPESPALLAEQLAHN